MDPDLAFMWGTFTGFWLGVGLCCGCSLVASWLYRKTKE